MNSLHYQRGQALPIVALGMALLLASAGVAMDMGYMRYERRSMQNAADSAAVAATAELNYGDYVTAGQTDAAANGFTNGVNGVTVTINTPPTAGQFAGQANFVEAIVSQTVPTFFMRALGTSSLAVSARAVGHLWGGPDCIYALDPSASQSYVASGSATLSANCGMMVDSDSSSAYVDSGGACTNATYIGIVGGISQDHCSTPASPTTGIVPVPNPLEYLNSETPAVGACTRTKFTWNAGTTTISPGVYCDGITIQGGGNVNFQKGNYILNGGGMTVSGGSNITGSEVMFYNTATAGHTFKVITVSGGSTTSLTAPTSGPYQGILFFQDPTITSSSMNTVSGGSSTIFQGALYFPTQNLTYSGGSVGTAAYTILVADTITISGNSYLGDDYSSLPDGSPVKTSILAE